jgi:phosphoglycolate phosphatase
MAPYRFAFFDLDGVLVQSLPGIATSVDAALSSLGFAPAGAERVRRMIGPPLALGFAELLRERGDDPALAAACVQRYRESYDMEAVRGTALHDGIAELLGALAGRVRLAVATSKQVRYAESILRALAIRDAFALVEGPTPATDGETKSATLARAIARTAAADPGFNAAAATMIGDRHHDVRAALENGVTPIGVTWGFGSERELRDAGATHLARTPGEVLRCLID